MKKDTKSKIMSCTYITRIGACWEQQRGRSKDSRSHSVMIRPLISSRCRLPEDFA